MIIHASCVAIDNRAILLTGAPGCGKSDLALRLIDQGARLISDDQTMLQRDGQNLLASPPATIAGMMEIRHWGLVRLPFIPSAPVALLVELLPIVTPLERLPEPDSVFFLDQPVQRLRLPAFASSTPAKIRAALNWEKLNMENAPA